MTEVVSRRLGPLGRAMLFLRQVRDELRKVVWPTRSQLATYTVVVIIFVTILAFVVSVLDLGFTKLILLVFG